MVKKKYLSPIVNLFDDIVCDVILASKIDNMGSWIWGDMGGDYSD